MIRLYDTELSANAHKCRMLMSMLGVDYERVEVNVMKGENRTPEFLALNPLGRVPVLDVQVSAIPLMVRWTKP